MFTVENIYFIFPIICLIFSLGKQTKLKLVVLFLFLTIFIAFSEMGSDYWAYENQYRLIVQGESLKNIHGEILFKYIMRISSIIGIDYTWFRVMLLSILYGGLSYLFYFMSINPSYSFFIIYSTYLIYICSAYRQFLVMVIILLSFYLFDKNKIKTTIAILIIGLFIHISSAIALVYFLFLTLKKRKLTIDIVKILIMLGGALIGAISLKHLKNLIVTIADIFNRKGHLMAYLDFDRPIISVGFLSRVFVLIVFFIFIATIKKNQLYIDMFYFYLFGACAYIMIPSELMAGRFSNNARIIEIILLPSIIFKGSLYEKLIKVVIFTSYLGLILYYQLLMQGGYSPYINIFF